jgi:hypothetical protein
MTTFIMVSIAVRGKRPQQPLSLPFPAQTMTTFIIASMAVRGYIHADALTFRLLALSVVFMAAKEK